MPRYAAFLRAINVGGRIVKMDRLRALFEQLHLANVQTVIASGNVLFDSPLRNTTAIEEKIERQLHMSLDYGVATFVRSASEVMRIAAYEPFPPAVMAKPYHALYVSFLGAEPTPAARRAIAALRTAEDEFHLDQRELYWLSRKPFSESVISGALIERTLGMPATARNVTTVRKIAAACAPLTPSGRSGRLV
jgi:uncharacterized protein (DUF1697 family)